MRRRTLTLALALTAVAAPAAHATSLVGVDVRDRASARLIQTLPGVESTGHGDAVVATRDGLELLRAAGLDPEVRISDLEARDRADRRADQAYAAQGASPLPSSRSSYRRLGDYDADMARLARTYPALVKPLTLAPASLEGRTLRGVEISDGVAASDGKPVFLMLGVHHAREWPSGEMSIEFAFDLARQFGKSARITSLLKRARVIVVPIVNPDGFNASRESPNDPQDPGTRVARLSTPALARTGPRARLLLRSLADVTAKVRVSRGKRTLARRTLALRGGRLTRISLPQAKGRRVTVKVTTTRGTTALTRRSAVTLRARGR